MDAFVENPIADPMLSAEAIFTDLRCREVGGLLVAILFSLGCTLFLVSPYPSFFSTSTRRKADLLAPSNEYCRPSREANRKNETDSAPDPQNLGLEGEKFGYYLDQNNREKGGNECPAR